MHKVVNQKTGIEKNLYIKPKKLSKRQTKKSNNTDILHKNLTSTDTKKEAKPVQNILSKVLKRFKPK